MAKNLDGGGASNSNPKPEVSDYDSDKADTPATIEKTVSNDQNKKLLVIASTLLLGLA